MTYAKANYRRRIVDDELDDLLPHLPAIILEGAKGVGKTWTAEQRAKTVWRLDTAEHLAIARADPGRLLQGPHPVLIDEWQREPTSWDVVRRAVDAGASPSSYLLTGSASPARGGTHSGALRIVTVRMRPLSLAERGIVAPAVSLAALLSGAKPDLKASCSCSLETYVAEIVQSGFPALRGVSGVALRAQLDGYIARVVDRDFPELGHPVRKPATLRRWLEAYAAATSTTAKFETIRDAATSDQQAKPARTATLPYRDVLERLWVLDPVPAWLPTRSVIRRLSAPPKHHLVDPALAIRLFGGDTTRLLEGSPLGPAFPRDGSLLGALFEAIVTLSVRAYAQAAEASVHHLRTAKGDHEVDLVVSRADGRIVAIEVKLTTAPTEEDLKHLVWLREAIGDELLDAVVITTGSEAYRRRDGIAVVPAALLGP